MSVPPVPPDGKDARALARVLNQVLQGRRNNTLDVTLATSTTSTLVTDVRISIDSAIVITARDAAAAAALTGIYPSAQTNGSVTLAHASTTAARSLRLAFEG